MPRTYTHVTIKQERFVLENYMDYDSNTELGKAIGLKAKQVRHIYRKHGLRKIEGNGCFKKRHTPWNKGKRCDSRLGGATKFKPGNLPAQTKPVGTIRTNKEGLLEVKYMLHKWRPLHQHIWIESNGPVPPGHVVVFKAGADKKYFTMDNLELITRRELMFRNDPKKRKLCS